MDRSSECIKWKKGQVLIVYMVIYLLNLERRVIRIYVSIYSYFVKNSERIHKKLIKGGSKVGHRGFLVYIPCYTDLIFEPYECIIYL